MPDPQEPTLQPSDTKALEGTTTVDATDVIEAEILAYRMLRQVAASIRDQVIKKIPQDRAILIHNEGEMNALTVFRTFAGQLSQLRSEYDALVPTHGADVRVAEVATTVIAATAALKAFIDLIALFRTDRQIYGVAITIEDLALVSEVGGALAAKQRKVYVTQLYPRAGDAGAIEDALDTSRERALAAKARIGLMADSPEKTLATERLQQLDGIYRGYEDLFTKVVAEGATALAALVRGAGIATLLDTESGANILYLKMLKAGGTNETKRSLLGSHLKHSGGVIANFILFDDDGSILFASTAEGYSGKVDDVM